MRILIVPFLVLLLLSSCDSDKKNSSEEKNLNYKDAIKESVLDNNHQVVLLESIDVGTYNYLRLEEGNKEFWAAISAQKVEIGKTYFYKNGMQMDNFTSKKLNRTFEKILFIQEFSDKPFVSEMISPDDEKNNKTNSVPLNNIMVDPSEGGISLAELFMNIDKYTDQKVIVRGVVVKMNKAIMNKNWIHIQDGSKYNEQYDLTITTTDDINFELMDTITFTGRISVDKYFGYGYIYDVLLEEAIIMNEM